MLNAVTFPDNWPGHQALRIKLWMLEAGSWHRQKLPKSQTAYSCNVPAKQQILRNVGSISCSKLQQQDGGLRVDGQLRDENNYEYEFNKRCHI